MDDGDDADADVADDDDAAPKKFLELENSPYYGLQITCRFSSLKRLQEF